MSKMVSLKKLASELDGIPDEFTAYLNRNTGELFHLPPDLDLDADTDDLAEWEVEEVAKAREVEASDEWMEIDSREIINQYGVMQDFVRQEKDGRRREQLLSAITGKGAFGRFDTAIKRMGLLDQWYVFRDKRNQEMAAAWLDAEGIKYGP